MKQLLLLFSRYTYIPIPAKYRQGESGLPEALRYLPLLGLFCGGLLFAAARLFLLLPAGAAAAALLAVNILLGGGIFLQELMTVADGIAKPTPPANMELELLSAEFAELPQESSFRYGKPAVVWGAAWLCAEYIAYLLLFRRQMISIVPLLCGTVFSRWIMAWLVFGFPAAQPAWLHSGFSKRGFLFCCGLALLILLPMSSVTLFMSLLTGLLGIYIFAEQRRSLIGGLDEACYGACVAWGDLLFLLAWLLFGSIMV